MFDEHWSTQTSASNLSSLHDITSSSYFHDCHRSGFRAPVSPTSTIKMHLGDAASSGSTMTKPYAGVNHDASWHDDQVQAPSNKSTGVVASESSNVRTNASLTHSADPFDRIR